MVKCRFPLTWLIYASKLALLALTMAVPSPVESFFDGLPFEGRAEVLAMAVALPALLIIGQGFLHSRWPFWLLTIAFAARLVAALVFPQEGLEVRLYEGPKRFQQGNWERNYQTLWHPGVSGLMRRPYSDVTDFPLEWLNRYDNRKQRFSTPVFVGLNGWARIPKGWSLCFVVQGEAESALKLGGRHLPTFPSSKEAVGGPLPAISGKAVPISGHVNFPSVGHKVWNLSPVLIGPAGEVQDAFANYALWRTREGAELSTPALLFLVSLSLVTDCALIIFFVLWAAWSLRHLWRLAVLDSGVLFCTVLGIVAPVALRLLGTSELYSLGRGIGITSLALIAWVLWRVAKGKYWTNHLGLVVLVALGPGLFAHYLINWWELAPRFTFYGIGDDWLTYKRFAQAIVLKNDWSQFEQNPVFTYQPLYRYIVALLHVFFGQSSMAQKLADVWSVVGSASIIAVLMQRWGSRLFWCLAAPAIYLWFLLTDRFLLYIGSGLQEYVAMLMMMVTAWAMGGRHGPPPPVWRAGVCAVAALWLRQDHVLGLAALALLAYEPLRGYLREAWQGLIRLLAQNWRWIAAYSGFLLGGILLVAARNWLGGGEFVLTKATNLSHLRCTTMSDIWGSISLLLNANDHVVGPAGWVLWIGVVAGLLCLLCRLGPLRYYPLELGIILASIIAPYFYVRVNAYTPRFSVHLLPFATISVLLTAESIWRGLQKKWARVD